MIDHKRTPRHRARRDAVGGVRQRADAGVGVAHIAPLDADPRQRPRRLIDQVIDLPVVDPRRARIAVVVNVGRAQDVVIQPGHGEDRASVGARREQHGMARPAPLEIEHQMRAARAADPPIKAATRRLQHRIDPGPRRVDHQPRRGRRPLAGEHIVEIDAPRPLAVDDDVIHRRVVAQVRARAARLGQILQRQPLRHFDLRVVEAVRRRQSVG